MGIEDVIKRILALRPQLTRGAVEKLIEEERIKAAGLLTDEAAAQLVASNLGLDGAGERIEAKLRIGDLTSGLNDVSLTGRIIHAFPARTFTRRDGRGGKVLRMLLGDRTGYVSVVCWDEKADHVAASRINPGKIVRVLHGYTRERRGEVEVNVGRRGQIYLEPLDAVEEDFPEVDSFFKTPREVQQPGAVNLTGVVVDRFPTSTFTRRDGSEGRVARLVLEEDGGSINLVFWDDRVEEIEGYGVGTRLRIVNGSVRIRDDGRAEVHVSWSTAVEIVEVGVAPKEPASPWTKLADLRNDMWGVSVAARVAQIGDVRKFTRRDGSVGRVASVLLEDDSGSVRLSLWEEDVEHLKELELGSIVAVENGYTRMSLGSVGLNISRNGRLVVDPNDIEVDVPSEGPEIVEVQDLREGQTNITIQGLVLETPQIREVETVRGPIKVASFRIDDGTGEARVSIWRDLIEEVEGLDPGTRIRIEYCNVRPPFDGIIQISSGLFTNVFLVEERESQSILH